jgi:hypothetical protein
MKSFIIFSILFFFSLLGYSQTKDTLESIINLKSVKVSTKRKKPIEIINERYATGLFSNMTTSRTYDLINNPPNYNGGTILDYLQNILNNVSIRRTLEGYELSTTRGVGSLQNYKKGIQNGGNREQSSIMLYLDEQQVESSVFFGIHPYEVSLVKYFPPGQSQIPFNQGMGILLIYTKKGDDLNTPSKFKKGELETIYKSIKDTTISKSENQH